MSWPEAHASSADPSVDLRPDGGAAGGAAGGGRTYTNWTVIPFLHTFPATDPSRATWVESCTRAFPLTAELLHTVPRITTALYSRLGPSTKLTPHTGWEDLANYVLRVHIPIDVPPPESGLCGLSCAGEVRHHRSGEIMVFDDSKSHFAFNHSPVSRVVLIIDILRPEGMPKGEPPRFAGLIP